jgi:hypothetical protein
VTVLPFQVFQRLTNPWGTPKTTEVVEDHPYRGSDCGSGFDASPTTYMSVSALPVTVS